MQKIILVFLFSLTIPYILSAKIATLPHQEVSPAPKQLEQRFNNLLAPYTHLETPSIPSSAHLVNDLHLSPQHLYDLLIDVNFEFHLALHPEDIFILTESDEITSLKLPTIADWVNLIRSKLST